MSPIGDQMRFKIHRSYYTVILYLYKVAQNLSLYPFTHNFCILNGRTCVCFKEVYFM